MLAAIVPSAIGFILIFVAFRNNNSTPGLITLGVSYISVLLFIRTYMLTVLRAIPYFLLPAAIIASTIVVAPRG